MFGQKVIAIFWIKKGIPDYCPKGIPEYQTTPRMFGQKEHNLSNERVWLIFALHYW